MYIIVLNNNFRISLDITKDIGRSPLLTVFYKNCIF